MTLRYTQVSQVDLQRQYKEARAYLADHYHIPRLDTVRQETVHPFVRAVSYLEDAAHLLEMYRRTLHVRRREMTLWRLLNRLAKVSHLLKCLDRPKPPEAKNERILASQLPWKILT